MPWESGSRAQTLNSKWFEAQISPQSEYRTCKLHIVVYSTAKKKKQDKPGFWFIAYSINNYKHEAKTMSTEDYLHLPLEKKKIKEVQG